MLLIATILPTLLKKTADTETDALVVIRNVDIKNAEVSITHSNQ